MRNKKRILFLLVLLCFLSALIFISSTSRRTVSYHSVEEVIQGVVRGYQDQDNGVLQSCYGKKAAELREDIEINFEKKFFLSLDAQRVKIYASENLFQKDDYTYVGVSFDFIKKNGDKIPYYEYYMVRKEKNGNYHVVTKKDCPREVMDYFNANAAQPPETELFAEFQRREKSYADNQPEFANTVYAQFIALLNGIPPEMEKNLRFLGIIFLIAILQLGLLYTWAYLTNAKNRVYRDRYLKNPNQNARL